MKMEHKFKSLQRKCIVVTEQKTIKLNETILVPTDTRNDKPSEYEFTKKTREITVFSGFYIYDDSQGEYRKVIDELLVIIDFVEALKAFNGNKLDASPNGGYKIEDFEDTVLCHTKVVSRDGKTSLKIWFKEFSENLYANKVECSSLAARLNKILQRCEAWQEQEV
jgi:hypothetical protein